MGRKRKTPAGLPGAGGYCDTLDAFIKFCEWGETPPADKERLIDFMAIALPHVRHAFTNPAAMYEFLATWTEKTPPEYREQVWQAIQLAALMVDAESQPGRISKRKARELRICVFTPDDLRRIAASQRRIGAALRPKTGWRDTYVCQGPEGRA